MKFQYRHLANQYFSAETEDNPNREYTRFALLRKVLVKLVEQLTNSGSEYQLEFDNLLLIVHYVTLRAAMKTLTGLGMIFECFDLVDSSSKRLSNMKINKGFSSEIIPVRSDKSLGYRSRARELL